MNVIDCQIVETRELRAMARHMDKLQGKVERLERDRAVLFWMFVIASMALGYVLANVPV
ncbi:hypothetical protein [Lachnoclostridium sp. An14]|uniref:hypothetical protein n=1 Tax=Lachnoclostridium sp. An14 TaxID=1965562 RepID=UPI0013A5F67B|nr:hypothetical protein [Lachnoclostridium sp. An14]